MKAEEAAEASKKRDDDNNSDTEIQKHSYSSDENRDDEEDNLSSNRSSPATSCIPRGEPLETVYSDLSGEDEDEGTEFFLDRRGSSQQTYHRRGSGILQPS